MRLINTKSFKLEEFSDGSIPPYAILSHTWGNDSEELSLDDVERGRIYKIAAVQAEPAVGSIKFRGCCRQAVEDGLGYVWIDTCCIDKANLVELSEAINSMFRWYSRATVCYAYLSDVPDDDDPLKPESNFQSSRWFQRGWTLQELLAPKNLRFYNSVWRCIGTKGIMSKLITSITHVPRHFLLGVAELRVASVAQRMSWAAQRRTKRLEDLAYCLLGIFGISMPMLYGEGEQAFFRLQEQIMKTTRDDSILAWGLDDESNESCLRNEDGGVLAPSPSHFANSGQIITREHTDNPLHSLDMSGGSLRIYMPLLTTGSGETFGLLNCGPASKPHKIVAIPLTKATSVASNEYVRPRQHPSVLRTVVVSGSPPELIHIKKDSRQNTFKKTYWLYEDDLFAHFNLTLVDVEPQPCWDKQTNLISPIASDQATTDPILLRLRYIKAECRDFVTVLEVPQAESNAEPQLNAVICRTVTCSRNTPLQEIAQNLQKFPSKELGGGSAESGVLHLRVKLKLIEGGIISINPEAVVLQSGDDTMLTSEDADLILDIRQLLRERKEIYTKNKELKAGSESYGIRLRLAEKGLEEVVRQIKELEERRRKLVKEEESSAREMNDLEHEKTTAEERQDYLSTRLPIVHEQLDNLSDGRRRQVCDALFSRALRNGDAEMMELLSDKVRERDGWIPLIAASIRGDVETVQQILSEGEIEPDSKDSVFGRTALSWASANGHTAIVEALLSTKRVDVNFRDQKGWTSLQWACRGARKNMALSLLQNGARVEPQRTISCLQGFNSVVFSHDSKLILSKSKGGTISVWNRVTGRLKKRINAGPVSSVAFSHDSTLIVSGSPNKNDINIYDITGKCQQSLEGHSSPVRSVAFSHDSKLVVSGSKDGTIKLWDSTGGCRRTFKGHEDSVSSVAFSRDSTLIVSNSSKVIIIWESTTGRCVHTLPRKGGNFCSVALSHDSKLIISGSSDGAIRIWDSATGDKTKEFCHLPNTHNQRIKLSRNRMKWREPFSNSGRGHSRKIYARSLNARDTTKLIEYDAEILDRQRTHSESGSNATLTKSLPKKSFCSVAFSHDSKLIISGSAETINIWDGITGHCLQILQCRGDDIHSVAFSHDSELFLSGSSDDTLKIWNMLIMHQPVAEFSDQIDSLDQDNSLDELDWSENRVLGENSDSEEESDLTDRLSDYENEPRGNHSDIQQNHEEEL